MAHFHGIMDAMKDSQARNFHIPLPQNLYASLREEARKRGRPATSVARQAIEDWLRQRQRMELAESIASYAAKQAGTGADLDSGLEEAGLETFRGGEE
jgi:predicted transcriptional regulator